VHQRKLDVRAHLNHKHAGRSFTSSFRKAWALLCNLRGRPAPHLGVRESPCRRVLAYHLTEEWFTSNRRAARAVDMPRPL